jgi:hypothetical protein
MIVCLKSKVVFVSHLCLDLSCWPLFLRKYHSEDLDVDGKTILKGVLDIMSTSVQVSTARKIKRNPVDTKTHLVTQSAKRSDSCLSGKTV